MATFKKLKSGKWQAQVARQGVHRARSFESKRAAQDWASRQEYLIAERETLASRQTMAEIFDR